jgi:xylan 1,4-beta-xylosidase
MTPKLPISRRTMFKGALAGAGAAALPLGRSEAAAPSGSACAAPTTSAKPRWGRSFEGQRKADRGNGTYVNPIVPGDHPDPTVLKDGKDYYMTFSSFQSYPGLIIWHSRDLVNWRPIGSALTKNIGSVWACDIAKHNGRYFIYIPTVATNVGFKLWAIHAERMEGPWSDPIDLRIPGCIDPGHAVGEDGKRYLFVNGIRKIRLTHDGLATDGKLEQAYDAWRYPEDWVVESFSAEGPKILRHGGFFYIITAVGGTSGPPTGHMVIVARSKSIHGPWEHCPHNPIVRTKSADEPWWSRGHATLVEGPGADWWMVYHAYENGFRPLGRQTILEPMEWTADGWPRALGGDLSRPLPKPGGGTAGPAGFPLSDDFGRNHFGTQWSFFEPAPDEMSRVKFEPRGLSLAGRGKSPADSSPLLCTVGDRAYEAEITVELDDDSVGGLLLFYNHKAFVGVGFDGKQIRTIAQSEDLDWMRPPLAQRSVRLKVTNDKDVVTFRYSPDGGKSWKLVDLRMEVSGYNHNTFGGFLALRIGLYSAGKGQARFSDFRYRGLAEASRT